MILQILNDVKIAHYLSVRENYAEDTSRIASFGLLFLTLIGFYAALLILCIGITYKFTGVLFLDQGILMNSLIIFGPYFLIFFGLINPKIIKKIDREKFSESEIKKKKKTLMIYKVCCVLTIPLSMLIFSII